MKFQRLLALVLVLTVFLLEVSVIHPAESTKDDRQQIIDHLHSIFKAFVKQDKEAIRELHTTDWTGFQSRSRKIVRGIDEYMKGPERSTANFPMQEYEIQDIEVQLYGDIAIVYYIAAWKVLLKSTGQVFVTRARSVDIYRKDELGWNQAGSHLTVLPAANRSPDCRECLDIKLVSEPEK